MTKLFQHYEMRQLVPAVGYRAVFSHEVDRAGPGGPIVIAAEPFDFVAVAQVKVYEDSEWIDDGYQVVGVELVCGSFEVLNECHNYHGIVREGDSWEMCIRLLPLNLRERAQKPDEETLAKFNGVRVVTGYQLSEKCMAEFTNGSKN